MTPLWLGQRVASFPDNGWSSVAFFIKWDQPAVPGGTSPALRSAR